MLKQYFTEINPVAWPHRDNMLLAIDTNGQMGQMTAGVLNLALPGLAAANTAIIWQMAEPVNRGKHGHCDWAATGDILCVAGRWLSPEQNGMAATTAAAYTELLTVIRDMDYPYPCRFWNYLPNINTGEGDQENYKQFCLGRAQALQQMDFTPELAYSAASALGYKNDELLVFLFACRKPGTHFENPLQQSAYHYPRQYGPSAPTFARATAIVIQEQPMVFISGTASVLGHATHAPYQLEQQLDTTMQNIDRLLAHIGSEYPPLQNLLIYLRYPKDYDYVAEQLTQHYPAVDKFYVQADICRRDLILEIEGFCTA